MIYDLGSLARNPMQSSTYRYVVTSRQVPSKHWPKDIALEAAIFSQSDISILWSARVLGLHYFRVQGLIRMFPEAKDYVSMNMASATYDDAYNYMTRGGRNTVPPSWVIPFILEDKKNGMTFTQLYQHWNYTRKIEEDFLKGQMDVFHSDA